MKAPSTAPHLRRDGRIHRSGAVAIGGGVARVSLRGILLISIQLNLAQSNFNGLQVIACPTLRPLAAWS